MLSSRANGDRQQTETGIEGLRILKYERYTGEKSVHKEAKSSSHFRKATQSADSVMAKVKIVKI